MSIYGYVRVSTSMQADEGDSLAVQQRQIEGWAHMHGLVLDHVYVERAVSGSVPVADREQGALLWSALKRGDTVIVAKLDRLFRSALDALQTVEVLQKRGVGLVLLDLGGDVTGNGLSRTFFIIVAAFAEAERQRIRERVAGSKADQKRRGRYLGGKVPFGYEVGPDGDLKPLPAEQEIIARARTLKASGWALRPIQRAVEELWGRKLSLDALSRVVSEMPAGMHCPHEGA